MMLEDSIADEHTIVVEIGSIPIAVRTTDDGLKRILRSRYGNFFRTSAPIEFHLDVKVVPPDIEDPDADAEVWLEDQEWKMRRGDFCATWNPLKRRGLVTQTANPYAIDSVLRIVHTLMLAPRGGFLLHASSAVRNGKAFLFSGVSEAGKTTMVRLAPPDARILTDEASYIRKVNGDYFACGTPFAGELGEPGENISAPIAALFFLKKGQENRIDALSSGEALRRLLRNVLFFAHQPETVRQVFDAAATFVASIPAYELVFLPDQRVWELIG
jgi:hypothetical protein